MDLRGRQSNVWALAGGFIKVHAHRMLIHQLRAQKSGDSNQQRADARQIETPWLYRRIGGVAQAQQPVQRRQRQQHDSQCSMTPAGDQSADTADQQHVEQTGSAGYDTTGGANAGQPQTAACPEVIASHDIGYVRCQQSEQGGYREVNQCRV